MIGRKQEPKNIAVVPGPHFILILLRAGKNGFRLSPE